MSTIVTIFLTCFILLLWNGMTNGLACYSCTNCNDPFNSNYVQVLYQNESLTPYYCSKSTVQSVTSRSIVPSCSPYGSPGNGQWCCQTNLCNSAKRNILTKAFSFGIAFVVFTILF